MSASANAPNTIVPRDSDLTPTARLQAVTTYLDQAIKNNTEIMETLQTRLARVHSYFEANLAQMRLQTDHLSVMASDLDTVSEVVARLSGIGVKKEERMEQEKEGKGRGKEKEKGKGEGEGKGKKGEGEERNKAKEVNKEKAKAKVNMATTTTTLTGAKIPAPSVVNRPPPKHPITAENPPVGRPILTSLKSPKPRTPPTTIPRGTLSSPYIITSSPSPFVFGDTTTQIHEPTKASRTKVEVKKEPEDENQNAITTSTTVAQNETQISSPPTPNYKSPVKQEPEDENQNAITTSTTMAQNETQIPSSPTPNHKSPGYPAIATNSTSPPIALEKTTTTDGITKAPGEMTTHEVPQITRRRSMHTTQSAQKHGTPIAEQSSNQTPAEPTTKARSPVLEPKAGARTTKKAIEGVSGQHADKIEPKPQAEMDVEMDVEMDEKPENRNQNTTTTTTGKSTKPRRAKTPAKAPRSPQRRSTRIMESVQKRRMPIAEQLGHQTPAKPTTKSRSPILKPKAGAGVTKKKATQGVSSQLTDKVEPKPQVDMGEEMDVEMDEELEKQNQNPTTTTTTGKSTKPRRAKTSGKAPRSPQRRSTRIMESVQKAAQDKLATHMPSSPILKPKVRAGVSKRGGRGGARGGRGRGGAARGRGN